MYIFIVTNRLGDSDFTGQSEKPSDHPKAFSQKKLPKQAQKKINIEFHVNVK